MPRPPRADEAGGLYHTLNRLVKGASVTIVFTPNADFIIVDAIKDQCPGDHLPDLQDRRKSRHANGCWRQCLDQPVRERLLRTVPGTSRSAGSRVTGRIVVAFLAEL